MVKRDTALILLHTNGPLSVPGNIHGNVRKCLTVWNLSMHEREIERPAALIDSLSTGNFLYATYLFLNVFEHHVLI